MKWSLSELRQAKEEPIQFETTLDLQHQLKERRPDLISMTPVKVSGVFTVERRGVVGHFHTQTTLTLPSTRTFDPVKISLDFNFSEYYVSKHQTNLAEFDPLDVVITLKDDILDLEKVIEDNILIRIPMQILSPEELKAEIDEMPKGEEWDVLTEKQLREHPRNEGKVDSRLAKLKDFFKKDNDSNSDE